MDTIPFGTRTGLRVSAFALGTGMLGTAYGYGTEPGEARALLDAFAEAGGTFFDTSDAYQFGAAEATLGDFLASDRDRFVVASKFGLTAERAPGAAAVGSHRRAMVAAVEASLRRLKTDRLDLYLAHLDDGATPVDEVMRGFDQLVAAGKVVYAGLSNFPAWRAAAAATIADLRGWAPLAALQLPYSLLERTVERELLPMARGLGLGVMGYAPLAGGVLTGKYRRGEAGRATALGPASVGAPPASDARAEAYADAVREGVLDAVLAIAAELGCEPAGVAHAWARARGVVPILGPRTCAQLTANLVAARVALTDAQQRRLDAASAPALGYPHDLLARERARLGLGGGARVAA